MFIENVILKDRSEPRRGDTARLPRPCVAPTGLDRILRRSVFYKHAAPLSHLSHFENPLSRENISLSAVVLLTKADLSAVVLPTKEAEPSLNPHPQLTFGPRPVGPSTLNYPNPQPSCHRLPRVATGNATATKS